MYSVPRFDIILFFKHIYCSDFNHPLLLLHLGLTSHILALLILIKLLFFDCTCFCLLFRDLQLRICLLFGKRRVPFFLERFLRILRNLAHNIARIFIVHDRAAKIQSVLRCSSVGRQGQLLFRWIELLIGWVIRKHTGIIEVRNLLVCVQMLGQCVVIAILVIKELAFV